MVADIHRRNPSVLARDAPTYDGRRDDGASIRVALACRGAARWPESRGGAARDRIFRSIRSRNCFAVITVYATSVGTTWSGRRVACVGVPQLDRRKAASVLPSRSASAASQRLLRQCFVSVLLSGVPDVMTETPRNERGDPELLFKHCTLCATRISAFILNQCPRHGADAFWGRSPWRPSALGRRVFHLFVPKVRPNTHLRSLSTRLSNATSPTASRPWQRFVPPSRIVSGKPIILLFRRDATIAARRVLNVPVCAFPFISRSNAPRYSSCLSLALSRRRNRAVVVLAGQPRYQPSGHARRSPPIGYSRN